MKDSVGKGNYITSKGNFSAGGKEVFEGTDDQLYYSNVSIEHFRLWIGFEFM